MIRKCEMAILYFIQCLHENKWFMENISLLIPGLLYEMRNWDSVVGIATGYGLED
jgi:hypothetical protein